jgi:hypothetical protein
MLIQIVRLVRYLERAFSRILNSHLRTYQKHQEFFGQFPRE